MTAEEHDHMQELEGLVKRYRSRIVTLKTAPDERKAERSQIDMLKQLLHEARAQRDELLAALKELVRDYELILGDGLTDSTAPPLLKVAHAAIAKAEG